jgi:hypothetical protein
MIISIYYNIHIYITSMINCHLVMLHVIYVKCDFRYFDDIWLDALVIVINVIELNYFCCLVSSVFKE